MMVASKRATEKLKEELITRCFESGLGVRLFSCADASGNPRFNIKFDNRYPQDEVMELHGVRVFLDPVSAANLRGCQLDYLEGPEGGFLLKNSSL